MDFFKEAESLYRKDRSTMVIKVREFSNVEVDTHDLLSSRLIDYYEESFVCETNCHPISSKGNHGKSHSILVHPDGYDSSTKGHVSLEFGFPRNIFWNYLFLSSSLHVELICVISVIDEENCRRFPQSFAFMDDGKQSTKVPIFFVESYVPRSFLLTRDDLLPNDTLTLKVEVIMNANMSVNSSEDWSSNKDLGKEVWDSFTTTKGRGSRDSGSTERHVLWLDSVVAERLLSESKYFEGLCAADMVEKVQRFIEIPDKDFNIFRAIIRILWKLALDDNRLVFPFDGILEVYSLAHYYIIESVLETCRCWLKLVCRTSDQASAIFELADKYDDDLLKKFAKTFATQEDGTPVYGVNWGDSYPNEPDAKWTYKYFGDDYPARDGSIYFIFELRTKMKENEVRIIDVTEEVNDMSNCYI